MPKKFDAEFARQSMLDAGIAPIEPYKNSTTPWLSNCMNCGEEISPTLKNVLKKHGCAYCANLRIKPSDAVSKMMEFNLKPLDPYKGATLKWKCKCLNCGTVVFPRYNDIQQGKGGCKKCGILKRVNPNQYSQDEAIEILKSVGLSPLEPYRNTSHKWKCFCLTCGKTVTPMLGTIISDKSGCRYCANIKRGLDSRLDSSEAKELMIQRGFIPLTEYDGKHKKWESRCVKCGKVSFPNLNNVTNRKSQCIYCKGGKVDPEDAERTMLESNLQPLEPYIDNKKKWMCKCLTCGEIVFPKYNGIQSGRGGCTNCAPRGMNLNAPSYLYLITSSRLNAHKVGIANVKRQKYKDRLHKFKLKDWEVHKVWNMESGYLALQAESQIFKILRVDMQLPVYLSKEEMPHTGGETETVGADAISVLDLEKIINAVIKR
jgi:formylmethanofuran dehydrogenase subunit E